MIKVSKLTKIYSGVKAVNDLSFEIGEGEVVGLLGLNGAGKTTVLKILGSYLVPSQGQVEVNGISTNFHPEKVREYIGYLPDTPPLYGEMTVLSYLEFVARLKNVPKKDVADKVDTVLAKTNIGTVKNKLLRNLSHGFQQRVGIAQALVHDPKVVILDEPINGLDPVQIVEMRDMILALKGRHTVILSSHILSEVTKTCDRILVIDRGKLIAEGDEKSLYSSVKHVALVSVELKEHPPGLSDKIQKISGVKTCFAKHENERSFLTIEMENDVRSAIANCIVNSGGELLGLKKEEDGLESIFLQMVKSSS